MDFKKFQTPFNQIISFERLIEIWQSKLAQNPTDLYSQDLLEEVKKIPELQTGFDDLSLLEKHQKLIHKLFEPLFPESLTQNEIKAAALPLTNIYFNPSQRFQSILENSLDGFQLSLPDFDEDIFYIVCCRILLSKKFKIKFNTSYPIYYNLTDQNGIEKYYRILYNADFMEVFPNENAVPITKEDVEFLLNRLDDIELWEKYFPRNSWTTKGFVIMNLYDATIETAISHLKQLLISKSNPEKIELKKFEKYLKSIFELNSLQIGVSHFNDEKYQIETSFVNQFVESFLLKNIDQISLVNSQVLHSFQEGKPFVSTNLEFFVNENPNDIIAENLLKLGYKSCLLIPIIKNHKIISVIELVSETAYGFNSFNFQRIELILSILVDSVYRSFMELENNIQAIIQKEYTSLHPSVAWKFKIEAENFLKNPSKGYNFREISFKDIFALYGEVDIKSSSSIRNQCTFHDLKNQLNQLLEVIAELKSKQKTDCKKLDSIKKAITKWLHKIETKFESNDEFEIQKFIDKKVNPIIDQCEIDINKDVQIVKYLNTLSPINGLYYIERNKFEQTVNQINKNLNSLLYNDQIEIQQVFPHYFEFFKTDGVEHSIYVGNSISPNLGFDQSHLQKIRFWQLETMCKMVRNHYQEVNHLPIKMDVTSLVLVYSTPISIRFRMDEKRFDVDGTYNARYEMVKKRIDKALIKHSKERISQSKKLTIVYLHEPDLEEYLGYVKKLQNQNFLEEEIELLEVQDLQGISGLKAIRVQIKYNLGIQIKPKCNHKRNNSQDNSY